VKTSTLVHLTKHNTELQSARYVRPQISIRHLWSGSILQSFESFQLFLAHRDVLMVKRLSRSRLNTWIYSPVSQTGTIAGRKKTQTNSTYRFSCIVFCPNDSCSIPLLMPIVFIFQRLFRFRNLIQSLYFMKSIAY
jgi:hypothetical protein